MKNKLLYTGILAIVSVGVYFLVSYSTHTPSTQEAASSRIAGLMCPEDYQATDEKAVAFAAFAENYVIMNPEAYGNDAVFTAGRADFLISRYCTETLMNFGYDGVSPIDAKIRQELITAMQNPTI